MKQIFAIGFIVLLITVVSCDIYKPQKEFRLAVSDQDYFYNYMTSHLKPFLENNGYDIEILKTASTIESNRMVARGEADLAFINNHSVPVTEALGAESGNLRAVLPLTTRLFFAFSKEPIPDSASAKELFENRKIGIEFLGGEAQHNLERFFERAKIKGTQIVAFNDNPDVIVFWGTFYGTRASNLLVEGWHPFSFKQNWIEFLTLNDPALKPYTLPAIPGDGRSIRINTIATDAILVSNKSIGENAIYELARVIFKNKLALIHEDIMYRNINENFDQLSLLYPIHEGTASFIRRDQPTFFERYADTIALVLSIFAVLYGGIQTIRNTIAKRKKDQVDKYFLDFLEIRQNKELSLDQKVKMLDNLFQRAVEQMTNEKLEKSDFHILSRLIQQELTMLRFRDN
jgi:hypothetical protein